jgi:hypothetical protein
MGTSNQSLFPMFSATLLQLEHFQRELTDLGAQLELAEQKISRTEMEAAESEEMLRSGIEK